MDVTLYKTILKDARTGEIKAEFEPTTLEKAEKQTEDWNKEYRKHDVWAPFAETVKCQ